MSNYVCLCVCEKKYVCMSLGVYVQSCASNNGECVCVILVGGMGGYTLGLHLWA